MVMMFMMMMEMIAMMIRSTKRCSCPVKFAQTAQKNDVADVRMVIYDHHHHHNTTMSTGGRRRFTFDHWELNVDVLSTVHRKEPIRHDQQRCGSAEVEEWSNGGAEMDMNGNDI